MSIRGGAVGGVVQSLLLLVCRNRIASRDQGFERTLTLATNTRA